MGVHGLWSLLKESGRPLDSKQMQGKVMAVDISIWLNMAVKGARDYHGNNALSMHLISLFHRICKLLHMGIKPVFVFDGKPPALKQKTLQERKQHRNENKKESNSANKKILLNKLKKHAIESLNPEKSETSKIHEVKQTTNIKNDDLYELPPLSSALENEFEELQNEAEDYIGYTNINELAAIKYEEKEFETLPDEIQYELLRDIKEVKKRRHTKIEVMPQKSESFSMYQIAGLLDKSKLSKRMTDMEKRMANKRAHNVDSTALMELFEGQVDMSTTEKVYSYNSIDNQSILIRQERKLAIKNEENSEDSKETPEEPQLLKRKLRSISAKEVTLKMKNKITTSQVTSHLSISDSGSSSEDESVDNKRFKKDDDNDVITTTPDESSRSFVEKITYNEVKLSVDDSIQDKIDTEQDIEILNSPKLEKPESSNKISEINNSVNLPQPTPTYSDSELVKLNDFTKNNTSINKDHVKNHKINVMGDDNKKIDTKDKNESFELKIEKIEGDVQEDSMEVEKVGDAERQVEIVNDNPWKDADLTNMEKLKKSLQNEEKNLKEIAQAKNRAAREVSNSAQSECKELLTLFGIPFIMSPGEAEAQCACLEKIGLTCGSITDDSDIWLFGGKIVIKDMFNSKRGATMFSINDIEDHLNLNRDKMIAIALCSGSDYTAGVTGIGPKTSIEIIQEFKCEKPENLQRFKDWCMGKTVDIEVTNKKLIKFKDAKLNWNFPSKDVINAYLNPDIDKSKEKFEWGIPDLEGLRDFAVQHMGWTIQKLNETLLPVIKKMSNCNNKKSVSKISRPIKKIFKKNTAKQKNNIEKFFRPSVTANQTAEPVLSEPSSDSDQN